MLVPSIYRYTSILLSRKVFAISKFAAQWGSGLGFTNMLWRVLGMNSIRDSWTYLSGHQQRVKINIIAPLKNHFSTNSMKDFLHHDSVWNNVNAGTYSFDWTNYKLKNICLFSRHYYSSTTITHFGIRFSFLKFSQSYFSNKEVMPPLKNLELFRYGIKNFRSLCFVCLSVFMVCLQVDATHFKVDKLWLWSLWFTMC